MRSLGARQTGDEQEPSGKRRWHGRMEDGAVSLLGQTHDGCGSLPARAGMLASIYRQDCRRRRQHGLPRGGNSKGCKAGPRLFGARAASAGLTWGINNLWPVRRRAGDWEQVKMARGRGVRVLLLLLLLGLQEHLLLLGHGGRRQQRWCRVSVLASEQQALHLTTAMHGRTRGSGCGPSRRGSLSAGAASPRHSRCRHLMQVRVPWQLHQAPLIV